MNSEEYFRIVAKENPLEFFSKHICPYLVGTQWDIIRKCSLLMGVTTDRPNLRMRLHILLCGGPGTGKSELLNWWRQKMDGVLVNSELTSKTGLVGDARGKTIHPGLIFSGTKRRFGEYLFSIKEKSRCVEMWLRTILWNVLIYPR